VVTYDQAQSLDVTGPAEVFSIATRLMCDREPDQPAPYAVELLARRPGPVRMSSGMKIVADRAYASVRTGIDTLVFSGGEIFEAVVDPHLRQWLLFMSRRVRRLATVCSGSFILAEAGLLNGRRATTHWSAIALMQNRYPKIQVEADAIFVQDGNIYTSAGITAGIDLALALVEEDMGHDLALAVARQLVVFLKRPGGQSQFSSHLAAQAVPAGPLKNLPAWVLDHLGEDLSVESLAARAAMSPRNFARVFLREAGVTPAKFVERARVDAARRLLEDGTKGVEEVAARCGFSSGEHMRRTFLRHLSVVPADYRRRFRIAS